MTIEIRQLIIRAVVEDRRDTAEAAHGSAAWSDVSGPIGAGANPSLTQGEDRQAFLAACVREVLRRLGRERDR